MSKEFTFATDVIAGREEDRSQAKHQFAQESGFGVLEDFHSFERVQVNVDGDLGFEFVCRQQQSFLT